MQAICLTFIVAMSVVFIGAQYDPIKVGEYRSSSDDPERVGKGVRLFVERLKREPKSTRGAIVLINGLRFEDPCVDNRRVEDKSFEDSIKENIPKKYRKRIVLVPSDSYSIRGEAEFYFVPSGAGLPRKIERILDHRPCCCSEMSIEERGEMSVGSKAVKFTLVMPIESVRTPPNPVWTVSVGRILSGQGTKSIEVELGETTAESIAVEVSITSPSPVCGCPISASFTARIRRN